MFTFSSVAQLKNYLDTHTKKYLVFDMDWTLLTLVTDWSKCVQEIYSKLKTIDPEFMSVYTPDDISYELYNKLIKKHGSKVKELIQKYYADFESRYIVRIDYFDELIDFLQSAKNKYDYFIWSSNQHATIQRAFDKHGNTNLFREIISAEDVDYFKPDSGGFTLLFNPKTQRKSEWLFVGDSKGDEQAAKVSGIDFFKLAYCTI